LKQDINKPDFGRSWSNKNRGRFFIVWFEENELSFSMMLFKEKKRINLIMKFTKVNLKSISE
jgi:hypothetical protein